MPAARNKADALCAIASARQERTFLALGHRLLAQIAVAEGQWSEAEAQLAQALSVIADGEAPLAAWRVYETAAELHQRLGHNIQAQDFREAKMRVLRALAASLGDDPSCSNLRQALAKDEPADAMLPELG